MGQAGVNMYCKCVCVCVFFLFVCLCVCGRVCACVCMQGGRGPLSGFAKASNQFKCDSEAILIHASLHE